MNTAPQVPLPLVDVSRVVEMAWEDRTPFEAIERQFGLNESAVVGLMRRTLKPRSFKMWRERMAGRATKHAALRHPATPTPSGTEPATRARREHPGHRANHQDAGRRTLCPGLSG